MEPPARCGTKAIPAGMEFAASVPGGFQPLRLSLRHGGGGWVGVWFFCIFFFFGSNDSFLQKSRRELLGTTSLAPGSSRLPTSCLLCRPRPPRPPTSLCHRDNALPFSLSLSHAGTGMPNRWDDDMAANGFAPRPAWDELPRDGRGVTGPPSPPRAPPPPPPLLSPHPQEAEADVAVY